MRGLWKAALLAPALVSANRMVNDLQVQDITSTTIDIPIPGLSDSPDVSTVLSFHVDVLASDRICGHGNLTINGQELAQEPLEFASTGNGSINVDGKIVEGSWDFFCLSGFYGPYAQRLDFMVVSVDGKAVEDVTFWVEFKQIDNRRIFSTSATDDDSNLWDFLPDPDVFEYEEDTTYDDFIDFENYDIEKELDELNWMKDLVEDFEYQISMKEEAMAMYISEENLDTCDSLKCVIGTVYNKARVTTHKVISKVYSKLSGEVESEGDEGGEGDEESMRPPWKKHHGKKPHWKKPHWRKPHWRKPHWRKPHWRKPHFPPKHGNHSHGNHTCPGKGNHTHPPPHHRRPPPFCRCPPPPRHGHRPPHRPPPHGPPHHGPPQGPPGKRPPPPAHDGPPGDRPHGPPPPPPGGNQGPPFNGPPFDGPPRDSPPDFEGPPYDGPPFHGPGSLSEFDGPRFGRKLHKIKTAVKFFAVATLLFLLVAVIHRRCCCSPARRQEKQARREERRRRRAFRRAAHKHAWRSWFARHICRSRAYDDLDEEEKRAMLARRPIEVQEDDIAAEISELSNAASVVSDMVAAEEGRMEGRVSMDSRTSSLPEYMSELGGEPLPTYEDEQGTGLSSVVADGFRYTPGSSEYTPGHSSSGSVSDVLGDVKE